RGCGARHRRARTPGWSHHAVLAAMTYTFLQLERRRRTHHPVGAISCLAARAPTYPGTMKPIMAVARVAPSTGDPNPAAGGPGVSRRAHTYAVGIWKKHARKIQSRITSPRLIPMTSVASSTAATPMHNTANGLVKRSRQGSRH